MNLLRTTSYEKRENRTGKPLNSNIKQPPERAHMPYPSTPEEWDMFFKTVRAK